MNDRRESVRSPHASGLVADGRRRVIEDHLPSILREVDAEHADALRQAGVFRRILLRWRMRREVRRRLEAVAPTSALY